MPKRDSLLLRGQPGHFTDTRGEAMSDNEIKRENRRIVAEEALIIVTKGTIGGIPFVGTLLNEALFESRSRLKQARLNAFFEKMVPRITQLEEEKIDKDHLRSEEFSDFFEELLQKVVKTKSEEKLELFRRVLLGAIMGNKSPDFSTLFLNILDELTVDEIKVFREHYELHLQRKEHRTRGKHQGPEPIDYTQETISGFKSAYYRQMLQSLIRKGVMFDDSHHRISTPPYRFVLPTDLGIAFFEWLSDQELATERKV